MTSSAECLWRKSRRKDWSSSGYTSKWTLRSPELLNVISAVKWMRPPCSSTARRSSTILPVRSSPASA